MSVTPIPVPAAATDHDRAAWALTTMPAGSQSRPQIMAEDCRILAHCPAGDRYQFLELHSPHIARTAQPGQFVMITVTRPGETGPALPRPMAIYNRDPRRGTIEILYGVVGDGTRKLSTWRAKEKLPVVGPLGRGFDIASSTRSVLLIGRGIGTCSLTTVAQDTQVAGIRTVAVTSGRTPDSTIGGDLYRDRGAHVYEVSDDRGTSTPEGLYAALTADLDSNPPDQILICGSDRLTRLSERLATRWNSLVQVSVEAHMACGIGYCHGCASGARSEGQESPLICRDGPVFRWSQLGASRRP